MSIPSLIKYIIVYFILIVFETNVIYLFAIYNITPDLILIFVLIISYKEERTPAMLIAFFAGLLQDVFSADFFGLAALTKVIIVFVASFFQLPTKKYSLLYYTMSFLFLIFFHDLVYQFIYALGGEIGFFKLLIFYILPSTIYTLIFGVMAYLILKRKLWQKPINVE